MNNEKMNRVDRLEERVNQLVRTKNTQKTSVFRMFGEGLLHLVAGGPIIAVLFRIITWLGEK
ncbi:hypothetical protein M3Y14_07295 [Bacillus thuringiensis]|uniref:hypothetical protein n=1 Tax=Bacillus thuringiensis TaxID=1428 RepID=UPI002224F3A7|nr:hypothetical protein [Bacillus thuringiensis]UYX55350.1 hypothetical protein M3Y14_07295 [Bacillus thuringiensis]